MWNGKMRVQVATFNEHQTTVVALASNSAGDTVCLLLKLNCLLTCN